ADMFQEGRDVVFGIENQRSRVRASRDFGEHAPHEKLLNERFSRASRAGRQKMLRRGRFGEHERPPTEAIAGSSRATLFAELSAALESLAAKSSLESNQKMAEHADQQDKRDV